MRFRTLAAMGVLLLGLLIIAAQCSNNGSHPVAVFTANPTSGTSPLTVNFDASASYAPEGTITTYSWDFGDGKSGAGVTISHTYTTTTNKTYTVNLTVLDDTGKSSSSSATISVTGSPGVEKAILISDGDPNKPQSARFSLEYTGGQVFLSSDPDGTGSISADIGFAIWVSHADNSKAERWFDFYCLQGICPKPPQDVTDLFKQGQNEVTVKTYNPNSYYVGEGRFLTSIWLVIKPIQAY